MMDRPSQSSLGGGRPDFPSTCWSKLAGPAWTDAAGRRAVLEDLAARYWKPIYAYIRRARGKSHDDAKDLAQDFFLRMMEGDFLSRPDPARGRFRTFLRVALKHYLANAERERHAVKRGGERPIVTLGEAVEWDLEDRGTRSPEDLLDALWVDEILTAAAVALERELAAEGKTVQFEVFKAFHLVDGAVEQSYREVGERLGIKEGDVGNHLNRSKARFREIIIGLVSETVTGVGDLDAELKELFGGRL